MLTLVRNCRLGPKGNQMDLMIQDGMIQDVRPRISVVDYKKDELVIIDGTNLVAVPGFVDMHVHLREPGFEHKEDIHSGTMAAAKGGYTTIFSMPNTKPPLDSVEKLKQYQVLLKEKAVIRVIPVAAISEELKGEQLTEMVALGEAGAGAFSDDGRPVYNDEIFEQAMKIAKASNLLIFDHCEDLELAHGGAINEGEASRRLGLKGINNASEALPIQRDINIAKKIDGRIHICHVSTAESVEVIRKAKAAGVRVTCEAGPHHIALTDEILVEGLTDGKVNPPLRSERDRLAVIEGIFDGTIDVIATDHAPHHADEKAQDFYKAPFGISGIETAFAVCYTELVKNHGLPFERLIQLMSHRPAELTGLEYGRIEPGRVADFALLDLEKEITVLKENFVSKGKNTPFHGRKYFGEVQMTFLNGKIVYQNNSVEYRLSREL